jgi:hypothetical protein
MTLFTRLIRKPRPAVRVQPPRLPDYLERHKAAQARGDFNPWKTSK